MTLILVCITQPCLYWQILYLFIFTIIMTIFRISQYIYKITYQQFVRFFLNLFMTKKWKKFFDFFVNHLLKYGNILTNGKNSTSEMLYL